MKTLKVYSDLAVMSRMTREVASVIADYAGESWDLLPWITLRDETWICLSGNPRALDLLMENQDKIDAFYFFNNPSAEHVIRTLINARNTKLPSNTLVEQTLCDYGIYSDNLCANSAFAEDMAKLALSKPMQVHWGLFSMNPNPIAVNALIARELHVQADEAKSGFMFHHDRNIRWLEMSHERRMSICRRQFGANPGAPLEMLREFLPDCAWYYMSSNPTARPILLENLDKIDDEELCKNPAMMDIILDGRHIAWSHFSSNSSAIAHLEANKDKIDWRQIGGNIAIFTQRTTRAEMLTALMFI